MLRSSTASYKELSQQWLGTIHHAHNDERELGEKKGEKKNTNFHILKQLKMLL